MLLNASYFALIQKMIWAKRYYSHWNAACQKKMFRNGKKKLHSLKSWMKHPRTSLGFLGLEWKPFWSGLNSATWSDSLWIWNDLWNSKSAELGTPCAWSTEVSTESRNTPQVGFGFFLKNALFETPARSILHLEICISKPSLGDACTYAFFYWI